MASKTKYVAVDPDGGEHTRNSHRTYTHAVLVYTLHWSDDPEYFAAQRAYLQTWPDDNPRKVERLAANEREAAKASGKMVWICHGFNGSLALAQKEAAKVGRYGKPGDRVEIVEVTTNGGPR